MCVNNSHFWIYSWVSFFIRRGVLTSFRKGEKWEVFDSTGRSRTATLAKTDRDWQMRKKEQLDVFTDEKRTSGLSVLLSGTFLGRMAPFVCLDIAGTNPRFTKLRQRERCWPLIYQNCMTNASLSMKCLIIYYKSLINKCLILRKNQFVLQRQKISFTKLFNIIKIKTSSNVF